MEGRGDGLKVVEMTGYLQAGVLFGVECGDRGVSRLIADEEFYKFGRENGD